MARQYAGWHKAVRVPAAHVDGWQRMHVLLGMATDACAAWCGVCTSGGDSASACAGCCWERPAWGRHPGRLQLTLAHLLVRPQTLPLGFRVPVGLLHQRLASLALDVLHVRLDRMRLGLLRHAHAWHATKLRGCQLQQAHQCCAREHSPADGTAADVVVRLLGQLSAW